MTKEIKILVDEVVVPYLNENRTDILQKIQQYGVEETFKNSIKTIFMNDLTKKILGDELFNHINTNIVQLLNEVLQSEELKNKLNSLSEKFLN